VPFEDLGGADLVVDQLYDGGTTKTIADEPLACLLPVGNQGGFRYNGSPKKGTVKLAVLYTTAARAASCTTPSAPAIGCSATSSNGATTRIHDRGYRRSCSSRRSHPGVASCSADCLPPALPA
jgi:hypothetical protein